MNNDTAVAVMHPNQPFDQTSFHLSTPANTAAASAANMLATFAGIGAPAAGKGERWRPMDHVRYLFFLTAASSVWVLRVLMDLFSCYSPSSFRNGPMEPAPYGRGGGDGVSSALVGVSGGDGGWACYYQAAAIGKAISHILAILNETPASSRKYEFILSTADRILADNFHFNHPALSEITRAALTSSFSRTCDLLRLSLETSPSPNPATWPTRLLHLLPLGPHLAAAIRLLLPSPSSRGGAAKCLQPEKLANELLWIAGKLCSYGAAGDAAARWAYSGDLAALTMSAPPRVQEAVVRMTAMMLGEMKGKEEEEEEEEMIRCRMLVVWVPVLCYAGNGAVGPVLTGGERWEVERVVEGLMAGLPWEDQEVILWNWLEDFASSDSDWPNLQEAFDRWCRHCRKLVS